MKANWVKFLLASVLYCVYVPAHSIEVTGLFQASVPVQGDGAEAEQQAIQAAFKQVLIKTAGNEAILQGFGVADAIEKAEEYATDIEQLSDDLLSVQFSDVGIRQLFRTANVPLWSAQRPVTLVWLLVNDDQGRRIVDGDMSLPIKSSIEQVAAQRGVPIVWPLMDLEDKQSIRESDISGGFLDTIQQASARYAPDAVLVGVVNPQGEGWSVRWRLLQHEQPVNWDAVQGTTYGVAQSGLTRLAAQLSARYAVSVKPAMADKGITLIVDNIMDEAQFVRLYHYLEGLKMVQHFYVKRYAYPTLSMQTYVTGDANALHQAIAMGLVLTENIQSSNPTQGIYHYRLGQ